MAVERAFSCCSVDFQLDSVCGVYEAGAAAVHFLTGHGAQIDQKPELIFGVVLLQSHMLRFVFLLHEKAAGLPPGILAFDAVVVHHIRRAVNRYIYFFKVRKAVFLPNLAPPQCKAPRTRAEFLSEIFFESRL